MGLLKFEGKYSNEQRWNGKVFEYFDDGNIKFESIYL